jgi:hypothetical protein
MQSFLYNHYIYFGPSGVRALPLAAGINVVAIVLGILQYNPDEPKYNPDEPKYNPDEPKYNPDEP